MAGQAIGLNIIFEVLVPVHLASTRILEALPRIKAAGQFIQKTLGRGHILVDDDQVRLLAGDSDVGRDCTTSNVEVRQVGIHVDFVVLLVVQDQLDKVIENRIMTVIISSLI